MTNQLKTPFALLTFSKSHYDNNKATALFATCHDEGYPENYAVISVNIMGKHPSPGCIWAKTWSENERLYNYLIDNGYLIPTGRTIPTGYSQAVECSLSEKLVPFMETLDD